MAVHRKLAYAHATGDRKWGVRWRWNPVQIDNSRGSRYGNLRLPSTRPQIHAQLQKKQRMWLGTWVLFSRQENLRGFCYEISSSNIYLHTVKHPKTVRNVRNYSERIVIFNTHLLISVFNNWTSSRRLRRSSQGSRTIHTPREVIRLGGSRIFVHQTLNDVPRVVHFVQTVLKHSFLAELIKESFSLPQFIELL